MSLPLPPPPPPECPQSLVGRKPHTHTSVHAVVLFQCSGLQACILDYMETGDFLLLQAALEAFLQECIDMMPSDDDGAIYPSLSSTPVR
jgi:hypothetical protein